MLLVYSSGRSFSLTNKTPYLCDENADFLTNRNRRQFCQDTPSTLLSYCKQENKQKQVLVIIIVVNVKFSFLPIYWV